MAQLFELATVDLKVVDVGIAVSECAEVDVDLSYRRIKAIDLLDNNVRSVDNPTRSCVDLEVVGLAEVLY